MAQEELHIGSHYWDAIKKRLVLPWDPKSYAHQILTPNPKPEPQTLNPKHLCEVQVITELGRSALRSDTKSRC